MAKDYGAKTPKPLTERGQPRLRHGTEPGSKGLGKRGMPAVREEHGTHESLGRSVVQKGAGKH